MTTIVTALYDIDQSLASYLPRFRFLLSLNAPMVIYTQESLQDYLQEHRLKQYLEQTRVIYRPIEELPMYQRCEQMREILGQGRTGKSGAWRRSPEYSVVTYSKFDWLRETAVANPFASKYFIWMDAGIFAQEPAFEVGCYWPDPHKMNILGDRCLRAGRKRSTPISDKRRFLLQNRQELATSLLGGTKRAIERVHQAFRLQVQAALEFPVMANDQNLLHLVVEEHPDYFLERSQVAPGELAAGTYLPGGYHVNLELKMLTLATREVPDSSLRRWETTAKYYGYNYEIMDRDRPWEGFGTKIRSLHRRLLTVTEPYVAMTDCTDVFFTGSADEMVAAFLATGHRAVVGGEMHMAYPKGRFPSRIIKAHFEAIKESPQCFPNSGFLIGYTADMIKLMELHLDYQDDQGPCFDTIYANKFPLAIDYRTAMVGNVPNYGDRRSEDYYEFDPRSKRYRSKLHGTTPQLLHFAGRYFNVMNKMYAVSQHHLFTAEDEATTINAYDSYWVNSTTTTNTWLGAAAIVLLVILVGIVLLYAGPGRNYAGPLPAILGGTAT